MKILLDATGCRRKTGEDASERTSLSLAMGSKVQTADGYQLILKATSVDISIAEGVLPRHSWRPDDEPPNDFTTEYFIAMLQWYWRKL